MAQVAYGHVDGIVDGIISAGDRQAGCLVKSLAVIVVVIDAEIAGLDILRSNARSFQSIHQALGLLVVIADTRGQVRVFRMDAEGNIGDIGGQVDRAIAADIQRAGLCSRRSTSTQRQCQYQDGNKAENFRSHRILLVG